MTRPAVPLRIAVGVLLGLLVAAAVAALAPTSAMAHAVLQSVTPAEGSIQQMAPTEVVLTFTEPVRATAGGVAVIDPDGERAAEGEPDLRDDGRALAVDLRDTLGDGTYVVTYRVISADGHPIAGGVTFSIGTTSEPATAVGVDGSTDPAVSTALSVTRTLGYLGLSLVIGPVLLLLTLWPGRLAVAGPVGPGRLVWAGWCTLAAATVVELLLQVPYTTGVRLLDIGPDWPARVDEVAASRFGQLHLLRLVVLVAALPLLRRLLAGMPAGRPEQVVLGALGTVAVLTWPLSGHAGVSVLPAVSVASVAVHIAAASVWLGGLVLLVTRLLPRARPGDLAVLLPIWSRWALVAVALLAFTGVVQALFEVGPWSALVTTRYGLLVLAKTTLLGVVVLIAAAARSRVRERYAVPAGGPRGGSGGGGGSGDDAGDAGDAPSLRGRLALEVGVGVVLLAVASSLVQATPGRTEVAAEAAEQGPYVDSGRAGDLVVQIEVDPARVGNNGVRLTALTADGEPQPVVEWAARASLPSEGLTDVSIPLLAVGENTATGQVQLPLPGAWEIRVTVRTSEVDQVSVTRPLPIR